MPGIILFTLVVAVVVIAILYLHDTRRARPTGDERPAAAAPAPPTAPPEPGDLLGSDDIEALASHVRELRRAVDEGLIRREEAIASIVRQADGRVGERAAEQLLDSAELD